jgi:hypothetical protein
MPSYPDRNSCKSTAILSVAINFFEKTCENAVFSSTLDRIGLVHEKKTALMHQFPKNDRFS